MVAAPAASALTTRQSWPARTRLASSGSVNSSSDARFGGAAILLFHDAGNPLNSRVFSDPGVRT